MHPTRREMMKLGLGSSALLACGQTVPLFLARSAHALAGDRPAAKGRILVVVQLDGGNDGLNTVVPYRDDEYRKRRPKLAISAGEVKKIDDRVGLHPMLEPFAKLLEAAAPRDRAERGIPQPQPFALRQHGDLAHGQNHRGQGGAGLAGPRDSTGAPDRTEMRRGCTSTRRSRCPGRSRAAGRWSRRWRKLEQFRRRLGMPQGGQAAAQVEALDRLARQDRGEPGSLLQFVERCSLITYASSARLERLQQDHPAAKADYPEFYGLARRLQLIAQLIKAGLTTAIYYTHLDGFDTHSGQLSQHANLMRELGRSLSAFLADLQKSGESERVVVLVFSEFGRRLGENGSGGTDHGTAAPVFLLGQPVKAGLHGPYPDLARLDDGDPIHAVDFRRVYATLLDRWLQVPHRDILGADFEPMPVLRG